jgi:hypothetical protein
MSGGKGWLRDSIIEGVMWLLPYEHFYMKTHLSQDKIIQKLKEVADTSGKIVWFPTFSKDHKLYRGKVNGTTFSIYRWINHQDSFLPIIDGELLPQIEGSTVGIRMHLHWLVIIFMTLWLGFFGITLANQIFYVFKYVLQSGNLPSDWSAIFGPLLFFLFGYGMMIIGFKVDVRREKQFIQELTEAYELFEPGLFETELSA